MDSKKPFYKSIPFWIVALFLLYSALGFFTVPYLIKQELIKLSEKQLNSDLQVEKISFNPFTISAEIKQLKLTDKDKTLWFSADTIYANINLWKTIFGNTSIAKVAVNNPYYHVVMYNNMGNSALKYPKITQTEEKKDESALLIDINSIEINQGALNYDDEAGSKHLSLKLKQIVFEHQGFTTKDVDTHFKLTFVTEDNSATKLDGIFNYPQLKLDAKWNLNNWTTANVFNFVSDEKDEFLGLKNKSGQINADGTIKFLGSKQKMPDIFVSQLNLTDFSTSTVAETEPQIALPDLSLKNIALDLNQEKINIESVMANNYAIGISITPDNNLIWSFLDSENTTQIDKQSESKDTSSWQYQLHQVSLNNGKLALNKQNKKQTTQNNIAINSLTINNFSNTQGQKFQLNSELVPDSEGMISIDSEILSEPLEITAKIKANSTNIAKATAWLPQGLNLTLEKGLLSLEQDFSLKGTQITDLQYYGIIPVDFNPALEEKDF
ncbi:MAG TPA: DUF748 domain-containing protein, partial [Oceanospirillales bacterium]|nr:DUF748 domain-containing protein [Oceanospirillales bacterium]